MKNNALNPSHTAARWRAQRGVTAIELIIVLAVIGAIIAAVATTAQGLFRSSSLTNEAQFVAQTQARLRGFYGAIGNTTGLNTTVAVASGTIPQDRINATGVDIDSRLTGMTIDVAPAQLNAGAANDAVAIQYQGTMTQALCSEFMTKVANAAPFIVVGANTVVKRDIALPINIAAGSNPNNVTVAVAVATGVVVPMTQATISNACPAAAVAGQTFSLVFPLGS